MSKITFRADDALVEQLDVLDASKSEVMREALREFLDRHPEVGTGREVTTTPEMGVDDATGAPELTINVSFDGAAPTAVDGTADRSGDEMSVNGENACKQCGERLNPEHSFCPNCGEEHERQAHCECGAEIQADWTFCPGCGRRSPASGRFDRA
ncbi:MAG: double zinc ribbon domain-containing protein [Halolamina sp.]